MAAQQLKYYLTLAICAMALILPTIINGYPLVNSDTATYLQSGFIPDAPWDRPITYGILLRIFSINGCSMWFAIFMQGYITAWLLYLCIKEFSGTRQPMLFTLATTIFLALFTSLSWVVSQLIADVYTGLAILCAALLIKGKQEKLNTILLYILYFICIAVHTAHFLSFIAIILLLLIFARFVLKGLPVKQVRKTLAIMLVLTVATIGIMGASMSKSRPMFFMASLLDKGILKPALDEMCADSAYNLCKYKDELPADVNLFMWEDSSPMAKEGGWRATHPEYKHIISEILSNPKYVWMYIKASIAFTLKQLITFNIGDGNTPFPQYSNVHNDMLRFIPHEADNFLQSMQNKKDIKPLLKIPNYIIYVTALVSIVVIILLVLKSPTQLTINLLVIIVVGLIINETMCATFSMVNGRYGCRVMWLIPFAAIVFILSNLRKSGKSEIRQ